MIVKRTLALLIVCVPLLWACSEDTVSPADTAVSTSPGDSAAVAWFPGSVEEAFERAREEGKPLFLYWGAEWCPYCKELQATIFIREEFIELSRLFINLDMSNGSSETIRYADQFKIYGLPTVIVFSPEGQELTRIPGGLDMEQYAAVLELTLNALQPVSELTAAVQAGQDLANEQWELLGAYSWGQDRGQALGDQDPAPVLRALAAACPRKLALACSRLDLAAIEAWAAAESPDPLDRSLHLQALDALLADPRLSRANLVSLAYLGGDLVNKLATGEEQQALQARLLALYRGATDDDSLNVLNLAAVLRGWGEVATALLAEGEALDPEQVRWAREQADAAMAELDAYQLHAGINNLWGVYYDIGLVEQARAALARGIAESRAPFYFMSGMAMVEREAGEPQAALDWYRKAWEATSNPLDRARWGSGYILRLIQLSPVDAAEIERAASAVLAEIVSQRNGLEAYAARLDRLSEALSAWAADGDDRELVLTALRSRLSDACAELTGDGSSPPVCASFLAQALVPAGA